MRVYIIITTILFIYIIFSTIFHDTAIVGGVGNFIGNGNFFLFGHFSYINIFILLCPLYKIYKDPSRRKDKDFYLGWSMLFLGFVLFNSLILENRDMGFIGRSIIEILTPLIGKVGLWLFWIMLISLSFIFLIGDDFDKDIFVNISDKTKIYFHTIINKLKREAKNPFIYDDIEGELPIKQLDKRVIKSRKQAPIPPQILVQPKGIKSKPIDEIDLVNDEKQEIPKVVKNQFIR